MDRMPCFELGDVGSIPAGPAYFYFCISSSMIYYLYEIKNLINNKIYIGVHKTNNINDCYMGSGKVINTAIKKYGLENFKKTILETFDTVEEMYSREREIVTAEFLLRKDVYNLRRGGSGGFDYINRQGLQRIARINADSTMLEKYGEDFRSQNGKKGAAVQRQNGQMQQSIERLKQYSGHRSELQKQNSIAAMNTVDSIEKKKETWQKTGRGQGKNNSRYGTMWITDGIENKSVPKDTLIPPGWRNGRTMK